MIAGLMLAAGLALDGEALACADVRPVAKKVQDLIDGGEVSQAAAVLESLGKESSGCSLVLVLSGQLELARKNYDLADRFSKRALNEAPDDPATLTFRGQILAMQGRVQEGRELLERSVKLDASSAEACFQLGAIYDRAKLCDRAVNMFKQVVKLRPRDARAYDYLALNLEAIGRIEDACDAYVKGLAENQEANFDWFLDYNYGRLLLKLNRLEEGKVHLDKALELVPQMRATHYEHAKLNVRLGKFAEARIDAEQALKIPDPGGVILDLQVYALLAQIYTRLGRHELAERYASLGESTSVPVKNHDRR